MKSRYKIFFFFIIIWFSFLSGKTCFAQNRKIDSLLTLIKTDKADTNKVNHSYLLCRGYAQTGNYDTAMYYGNSTLALAQQLNFKKGIANIYNVMGIIFMNQGNYSKALDFYSKALEIGKELKDKNRISKCFANIALVYSDQGNYQEALNYFFKGLKIEEEAGNKVAIGETFGNIGGIYYEQSDYPKALNYFFDGLKIGEERGDKNGIRTCISNIGLVYCSQGDYPKALDYDLRELKMVEEAGDKVGLATVLGNIGIIYASQKEYSQALDNYFKALKIDEELGDKNGIAKNLGNIGQTYSSQGNYLKALDYFFKALKISEELGDKNNNAIRLTSIGRLYTATGKYKEAEKHLKKAIAIEKSIGTLDYLNQSEELLSLLYDTTGRYEEALIHYKKAIELRNTIFSQENKKQLISKEMNYGFGKKEIEIKAEEEKQKAIAEEKNYERKFIIRSVVYSLLIMLAFAGFLFRSLRITRKQRQIIETKNTETEHQKKIIEEKNKDITASIQYAKQIQTALLREEAHVSTHLPEHFILFMPKDIVSGDFYWGAEKLDYWYFAAVDCTGHGVPGAIMSMLGISFLNEILSSKDLLSPAQILDKLRDRVVEELRQKDESIGNKDGMDISLVRLNLKTYEIQWAGANNALNFIRNGELEEIKGNKQPIGYYPEQRSFTNHEIQLQKGDSIYIYSDGYADQFGGEKGKKLTYKKLKNLIMAQKDLPMKDQKEILKNNFTEWKGSLEQVDDVCVIGVKI